MQAECCYSFDPATGLSMRRVDPGYEAQAGEFVSGPDLAANADLEARWPGSTTFVLPPTSCTRLGLMRAFTEMGLWAQVKAFIAGDPVREEQWDLATTLKLSDPIMVSAIQAFALSGITIDPGQLATRANALVA